MTGHRFTVEVFGGADQVIGYRCADPGCSAVESAAARAKRVQLEAQDDARRAEERQEAERRTAERETARAARVELVPWACERCGKAAHLPRWRAERKAYCCGACRRARKAPTGPCAACAESA